jgi:hypothetical protein
MNAYRNDLTAVVLCCLCVVLVAIPAYGYIEPNAARLVSQIFTPVIVAAAGLTFFRKRVAEVFAGVSQRWRGRADVQ